VAASVVAVGSSTSTTTNGNPALYCYHLRGHLSTISLMPNYYYY
jgi:hypothetical protein